MGELRERLRARGARGGDPPAAVSPAAVSLAAVSLAAVSLAADASPTIGETPTIAPLPGDLHSEDGPEGAVLVRTQHFAPDDPGRLALELDPTALVLLARDPALARFDPRRAAFLDTETTSLSGGAGVLVFLVAIGRLGADGGFTLRQFFLGSPGGERAMLAAVVRELAECAAAVTFFGKAFDRHRLEDKIAIHGLESTFPAEEHADLCHISRARFGWKLADARLRTVERSILGISRVDDLPGSEAPKAYFDWLGKRPSLLARVFDHNRDDVRSLVSLLVACAAPLEGAAAGERLAAARGAAALGDFAAARGHALAAHAAGDPFARRSAARIAALATRRLEGGEAARPFLEELAGGGCAESTLALARLEWARARDANKTAALLDLADGRTISLPVGSGRDALRASIGALRRRVESQRSASAAPAASPPAAQSGANGP